jgi:hypothetical protein
MDNQIKLPLRELISTVKAEIAGAMQDRQTKNDKAMFKLTGVTLEVNFVIGNEQGAAGDFKAKLFAIGASAGGKVTYKNEEIHKVTVQLAPYEETGVGDESPYALFKPPPKRKSGGYGPILLGKKVSVKKAT